MQELQENGILFGASVTVQKQNMQEVSDKPNPSGFAADEVTAADFFVNRVCLFHSFALLSYNARYLVNYNLSLCN